MTWRKTWRRMFMKKRQYQTVNLSYWYRFKKAKYRVWRSRKAFLLVQVIDNSWKKSSANKMAAVVIMFRILWENFVHSLSVLEKAFTEGKSKSFSRSKIRQIFSVLTSFSCCGVARISKKESFVLLDLYILVMKACLWILWSDSLSYVFMTANRKVLLNKVQIAFCMPLWELKCIYYYIFRFSFSGAYNKKTEFFKKQSRRGVSTTNMNCIQA